MLLGYIDLDEQESVTLEFLLGQDYVQEDAETARRIALKLLESEDKIPGSAADLAFWTWRKHTVVDFRNIDEALAVMEAYLVKWNPYDREAILELLEAFKTKDLPGGRRIQPTRLGEEDPDLPEQVGRWGVIRKNIKV